MFQHSILRSLLTDPETAEIAVIAAPAQRERFNAAPSTSTSLDLLATTAATQEPISVAPAVPAALLPATVTALAGSEPIAPIVINF